MCSFLPRTAGLRRRSSMLSVQAKVDACYRDPGCRGWRQLPRPRRRRWNPAHVGASTLREALQAAPELKELSWPSKTKRFFERSSRRPADLYGDVTSVLPRSRRVPAPTRRSINRSVQAPRYPPGAAPGDHAEGRQEARSFFRTSLSEITPEEARLPRAKRTGCVGAHGCR